MNPSFVWKTDSSDLDDLQLGIDLAIEQGVNSLAIFSCCSNQYSLQALNLILTRIPIIVVGGCFPMLIDGHQVMKQGAALLGFNDTLQVSEYADLTNLLNDTAPLELQLEQDDVVMSNQHFFLFYDGLMAEAEDFIDVFYDVVGSDIKVAGGGAGNLALTQTPCIYSNKGVLDKVFQVIAIPSKIELEIAHGWQILDGPYLVTRSEGNVIHSLNYQPAFSVYKHKIESSTQYLFGDDNFFEISKHFPFGIQDVNDAIRVRDPIKVQDDSLVCVGKVGTNSLVYILDGPHGALIESEQRASQAVNKLASQSCTTFIFDCLSRILYLGDDYTKSLEAIADPIDQHVNLLGVLSLGEIASSPSCAIKLLNKSTVIVRVPHD